MHAMDDLLAAALGQVSVLDEGGAAVRLGDVWAKRPAVLALVRHLGCLFCRQQVAELMRRLPEIERRSATLVVVGPSRPEHIAAFRTATGYPGLLFVDPSLRAFRAAGLEHSRASTYHPLAVLKAVRAVAQGHRQTGRQGDIIQQGGTFVLGPGDRVHFEWRDRYAGDHADLDEAVEAIPAPHPQAPHPQAPSPSSPSPYPLP
jgi:peroxiredoxin